jgi:hypothetical protein
MPSVPELLSEEQRASFRETGFLSLPVITTAEEVTWVRTLLETLFAERTGWESGDFFDAVGTEKDKVMRQPQMIAVSDHAPLLKHTLFRANALAFGRQLFGPQATVVFEHAMLKPPGSETPTPWHQDEAYYLSLTRFRSLTIWMPLYDVTEENGCLWFIPGSHKRGLVSHRSLGNDPAVHSLEALGVPGAAGVACPLPAGGATIHHYRTLHWAGPNRSAGPRLAYALGIGVRTRLPIVWRDHEWNAGKRTAQLERQTAAHPVKALVKQVARKAAHLAPRRKTRNPVDMALVAAIGTLAGMT